MPMESVIRIFIKLFLMIISKNSTLNFLFQFLVKKSKRFQFLIIILSKHSLLRSLIAPLFRQSENKKCQYWIKQCQRAQQLTKFYNNKSKQIQKFKMITSTQHREVLLNLKNQVSQYTQWQSYSQSTKILQSKRQVNIQIGGDNMTMKNQNSFEMIEQMQKNYQNYDKTLRQLYEEQNRLASKVQPITTNFCESVQISIQSKMPERILQIIVISEQQYKELSNIIPKSKGSPVKRNENFLNISGKYLEISKQNQNSDESWNSERSSYKQRDFYHFGQTNGQNLQIILNSECDNFGQQKHTEIQQIENQFEVNEIKVMLIQQNDSLKAQIQLCKQQNQLISKKIDQYQNKISQQTIQIQQLTVYLQQLENNCKVEYLQKNINEKAQTIKFLQMKLTQREYEIQANNLRLQKIQRQRQYSIQQLVNERNEIQLRLCQRQEQLSNLKKVLQERNYQIEEILQSNRNFQQHFQINQAKQQDIISQRNTLQDQIINLKIQFDRVILEKQAYENIQQEYEDLLKLYKQGQNTINTLMKQLKNYEKIINQSDFDTKNSYASQIKIKIQQKSQEKQFQKRWSDNRSLVEQYPQSEKVNEQECLRILSKNKSQQFFKNGIQRILQSPLMLCLKKMQNQRCEQFIYDQRQLSIRQPKESFEKVVDLQGQLQRKGSLEVLEGQKELDYVQDSNLTSDIVMTQLERFRKANDVLNAKIEVLKRQNEKLNNLLKNYYEQLQSLRSIEIAY